MNFKCDDCINIPAGCGLEPDLSGFCKGFQKGPKFYKPQIDWIRVGRHITDDTRDELMSLFDIIPWQKLPLVDTSMDNDYAFGEIIQSFDLSATHVGEIRHANGFILAVRASYVQGTAEVFFLSEAGVVTPLAVYKYW